MKPLDITQQIEAVTAIVTSLQALGEAEDLQLLADSIEGETQFFEVVDRILVEIADDEALVAAIDAQVSDLKARKERFTKRAETRRAVLEQAFVTVNLPKIERPLATLFLSKRAPKVVIETESEIPARYWKPADPTLDRKQLADELKARRDGLAAVFAASEDALEAAVASFHQQFLDDAQAAAFRVEVAAYAGAESDQDREKAAAALRRDFGSVPGATLADATPSLSIRSV